MLRRLLERDIFGNATGGSLARRKFIIAIIADIILRVKFLGVNQIMDKTPKLN